MNKTDQVRQMGSIYIEYQSGTIVDSFIIDMSCQRSIKNYRLFFSCIYKIKFNRGDSFRYSIKIELL